MPIFSGLKVMLCLAEYLVHRFSVSGGVTLERDLELWLVIRFQNESYSSELNLNFNFINWVQQ